MEVLIGLLVIVLILLLGAVLGSGKRGDGPAGMIGLVTLIVLILMFFAYV